MKRPYRFLLMLLAVIVGAVVWWMGSPSEPAYQGKPLSRWIAEIKAGPYAIPPRYGPSPAEYEAVKAMGVQALPLLLESVRPMSYEPWRRATYRRSHLGLPLLLRRYLPEPPPLNFQPESAFQEFVVVRCDNLWRESEPLLIKSLRHPRAEVRVTAAMALRLRPNRPLEVLNALTNCLLDTNEDVRRFMVLAIANFGPAASNAVPAIVDNILPSHRPAGFQPSDYERAWAANTLGRIGPGAVAAIPVLQAGASQRTNVYFRVSSAIALWQISHHASEALPVLMEEFYGISDLMKSNILDCLGEMGPAAAEAVTAIILFLESNPDPQDPIEIEKPAVGSGSVPENCPGRGGKVGARSGEKGAVRNLPDKLPG